MKKRNGKKYQKVDYAPANFLRILKRESLKKRRGILRIVMITISIAVAVKLLVGPFGTIEMIRMSQKHRLLKANVTRLSTELANLEWEARQLTNPFYIEKLARERYWMLKPGEIIIKLPPR
jgi:cell division protein FtsB